MRKHKIYVVYELGPSFLAVERQPNPLPSKPEAGNRPHYSIRRYRNVTPASYRRFDRLLGSSWKSDGFFSITQRQLINTSPAKRRGIATKEIDLMKCQVCDGHGAEWDEYNFACWFCRGCMGLGHDPRNGREYRLVAERRIYRKHYFVRKYHEARFALAGRYMPHTKATARTRAYL